jgi:hypothetical protein
MSNVMAATRFASGVIPAGQGARRARKNRKGPRKRPMARRGEEMAMSFSLSGNIHGPSDELKDFHPPPCSNPRIQDLRIQRPAGCEIIMAMARAIAMAREMAISFQRSAVS